MPSFVLLNQNTTVIQTLTRLMKNSFHDRQLVLVNTARALKFLESYAA